MASLSEDSVQDAYVAKCLNILQAWPPLAAETRLELFRTATQLVAIMVPMPNMPVNKMIMGALQAGRFIPKTWTIEMSEEYLIEDADDYNFRKKFILFCSAIYHEMRHVEQFYRIIQGTAAGYFKIPSALFPDRNLVKDLAGGFGVPLKVAVQAMASQEQYPRAMHETLVRGWYRSIYGFKAVHRATTLAHALTFGGARPYQNLPEESDAFRMQDGITQKLNARIGVIPG